MGFDPPVTTKQNNGFTEDTKNCLKVIHAIWSYSHYILLQVYQSFCTYPSTASLLIDCHTNMPSLEVLHHSI